jgi:hypothetical protein
MRSLGGLLRLTHVVGHARRAGARASMVCRSWFEGPAGPGDVHSLETTTVRASYGHGDNDFCVVGCRTTPWYGAAGMPSTLLCTILGTPGCDLVSPKVAPKHTIKNSRLFPVEFCAVCVALVTTTRGSSECRPDDESRSHKPLCGALWREAGTTRLCGRTVKTLNYSGA